MQAEPDIFDLAAKVVVAYVAHNSVPSGQLPELVSTVHQSLRGLGKPVREELKKATEAQIRASIRPDSIISFEDGKPYKALRRHLTLRGLSPEAYRAKWGLPIDYPLVCATYSAERSRISRAIGLGQKARALQQAE